jgi:hypothetical protein
VGENLAGKLFFRVWLQGGVLVYRPVADVTGEAFALAAAAAMAAAASAAAQGPSTSGAGARGRSRSGLASRSARPQQRSSSRSLLLVRLSRGRGSPVRSHLLSGDCWVPFLRGSVSACSLPVAPLPRTQPMNPAVKARARPRSYPCPFRSPPGRAARRHHKREVTIRSAGRSRRANDPSRRHRPR